MSGQPIKNFQPDVGAHYLLVDETPTDFPENPLQPGDKVVILAQRKDFTLVLTNGQSYLIDNETLVIPQ